MSANRNPNRPIYLDYHSTTPVDPRVAEKIFYQMTEAFGNASSVDHQYGDEAETAVTQAASNVAELIGALPKQIIWTSGATESINLAIFGHISQNNYSILPRIAILPVEHQAVIDTCAALAKQKLAKIIWLEVDRKGRVNLEHLENVCAGGISLLCVMAANNEIGNIYPIEKIVKLLKNITFLFSVMLLKGWEKYR